MDERDALNERLAELEADLAGWPKTTRKRLSQLSRLMQLLSGTREVFGAGGGE